MATGNLLLGYGRGKIGDVVLYRFNGKQAARPRVRKPANPQTSAQNIQRMLLATVAGNAARLRPLISHSFQGVKPGQDSYNLFNKVNLDLLRSYVSDGTPTGYRIKGAETFTLVPGLILGRGSINTPQLGTHVAAVSSEVSGLAIYMDNDFASSAALKVVPKTASEYTAALQTIFGVAPGDEIALTLAFIVGNTPAAAYDGFYQPNIRLATVRWVFRSWDVDFAGNELFSGGRLNDIYLDFSVAGDGMPRTLSANRIYFAEDLANDEYLCASIPELSEYFVGGAMFISRPDGKGGWLNSNSTLVTIPAPYYVADELQASDIAPSYGASAAAEPTSDYYLEQSVAVSSAAPRAAIEAAVTEVDFATSWSNLLSNSEGTTPLTVSAAAYTTEGVTVALNFVPDSVTVSAPAGIVGNKAERQLDYSGVPAGSSVYNMSSNGVSNAGQVVWLFRYGNEKVRMVLNVSSPQNP